MNISGLIAPVEAVVCLTNLLITFPRKLANQKPGIAVPGWT